MELRLILLFGISYKRFKKRCTTINSLYSFESPLQFINFTSIIYLFIYDIIKKVIALNSGRFCSVPTAWAFKVISVVSSGRAERRVGIHVISDLVFTSNIVIAYKYGEINDKGPVLEWSSKY